MISRVVDAGFPDAFCAAVPLCNFLTIFNREAHQYFLRRNFFLWSRSLWKECNLFLERLSALLVQVLVAGVVVYL